MIDNITINLPLIPDFKPPADATDIVRYGVKLFTNFAITGAGGAKMKVYIDNLNRRITVSGSLRKLVHGEYSTKDLNYNEVKAAFRRIRAGLNYPTKEFYKYSSFTQIELGFTLDVSPYPATTFIDNAIKPIPNSHLPCYFYYYGKSFEGYSETGGRRIAGYDKGREITDVMKRRRVPIIIPVSKTAFRVEVKYRGRVRKRLHSITNIAELINCFETVVKIGLTELQLLRFHCLPALSPNASIFEDMQSDALQMRGINHYLNRLLEKDLPKSTKDYQRKKLLALTSTKGANKLQKDYNEALTDAVNMCLGRPAAQAKNENFVQSSLYNKKEKVV